jgi:hypothetical protein
VPDDLQQSIISKMTEFIIEAVAIFVSGIKKRKSPYRAGYGLDTKNENAASGADSRLAGVSSFQCFTLMGIFKTVQTST